ncbi:MAG: FAD binding domain-containing protein, partial [Proteobacteria bacterium]|nr:FAD binding domain-containing protein [Pseudomonadota bacterium]
MGELRYEFPDTLDAAVVLLAGESGAARVIAGGTDVLVQLRADTIEPGLMVGINNIPEVRTIAAENGGFRFGA